MNLLATTPAVPAELSPLPISIPALDPSLLAMSFSAEMQDCVAPAAEVTTAELTEPTEQPLAAITDTSLLSMPAFFAPIIPQRLQPPASAPAAEWGLAEQISVAPAAPALIAAPLMSQPRQDADAPVLKNDAVAAIANDAPDQPLSLIHN